jgi:hypothetical protein
MERWNHSNVGIENSNPQQALDINGTCAATMFAGSLGWGYLTSVPALCSNTSPQFLYGSNIANWSSNQIGTLATTGNYTWALNASSSNVNDASFSSNVSVGLGITANSLTVNDMFVNNTINALVGISSGGNIISLSSGGNNLGTSGSPWGNLNTLTASLEDATTTTLSNSGVIPMNYGDGDKIVLTNGGTNASVELLIVLVGVLDTLQVIRLVRVVNTICTRQQLVHGRIRCTLTAMLTILQTD